MQPVMPLMVQPTPDEALAPPGAKILAAVSGGADSLALLWWLLQIGREVLVGHVHHDLHELRHGDCDDDEGFVRERCAALGVPFSSRKVALPRKNGHVNEAVAREARYGALAEMARENGCLRVATGHTATDNLETALLNLARGAGVAGIAGFSPARVLGGSSDGNSDGEIWLVRPFWSVPRAWTRAVLRENGWQWREDASNCAPIFRRNRVRSEILPLLEEISERPSDQIALSHAQSAQIWRDEFEFLENEAARTLQTLARRKNGVLSLDGVQFREIPAALQRRVLRRGAWEIAPELRGLQSAKIEETRRQIVENGRRMVWEWGAGLRVEWTGSGAGNRVRFWRV